MSILQMYEESCYLAVLAMACQPEHPEQAETDLREALEQLAHTDLASVAPRDALEFLYRLKGLCCCVDHTKPWQATGHEMEVAANEHS